MKNPGIYILTSPSGKKYVGKDENLPRRPNEHLKGRNSGSPAINNAIKKYGGENFTVEIIRYPGISSEALYAVEQWKIKQLGTKSPNGYNLTDGGPGTSGFKHSEESKRKMSESSKNPSEETRRKMSEAHTGKTLSVEHRRKIADAGKGRVLSPDARRKISEKATGRRHSAETLLKIGEASKGRTHTEETRRKISDATSGPKNHHYGKKHSAEARRKISKAQSDFAARRKKKIYWMYILSLARVWYESYDAVMKRRAEFFSSDVVNTSGAEQLTFM